MQDSALDQRSALVVDESAFPLVRIRWAGALDDEGFDQYLAACETFLEYGSIFAIVLDATAAASLTGAQRERQSAWFSAMKIPLRERCAGLAMVIAKPWVRRLLAALRLVSPLPCPSHLAPTVEDAEAWCRAQVAERRVGEPVGEGDGEGNDR